MKRGRILPRYWSAHLVLLIGVFILAFPVYMAVVASTHDAATIGRGTLPLVPGPHLVENYVQAWSVGSGARVAGTPVRIMMLNSFIMAVLIAVGKITASVLSAYAFVFFQFPLRGFFFGLIFVTLMLPLEVRIIPSYKVATDLGLLNNFAGLTLPLMVSATGTLLFRQVFRTIPRELIEAAKIDGAGPMRTFWSIVLPLARPSMAALFVILFIYGWNQYLWPLLITTRPGMDTMVIGIVKMLGISESLVDWNIVMATTVMALSVPVLIVLLLQRWLLMGLMETEK